MGQLTALPNVEERRYKRIVQSAQIFFVFQYICMFPPSSHQTPQEKLPLYHLSLAAAGAGAITSFLLCVLILIINFAKVFLICTLHAEHQLNLSNAKCKFRCL